MNGFFRVFILKYLAIADAIYLLTHVATKFVRNAVFRADEHKVHNNHDETFATLPCIHLSQERKRESCSIFSMKKSPPGKWKKYSQIKEMTDFKSRFNFTIKLDIFSS
jgi:hypothetical protein